MFARREREREGGRFPSQDSHKAVGAETGSHVNRLGVLIFSMRKYAAKGYQSPESPLPTLSGDINYTNSYGHCRCLRGNGHKARRAGTIWIKLITRHSQLKIEISHWGSYLIFSPWFPSPFHKTWHRFEHITVTEQYPHCYKCESREPQHSGWWPWLCSRLQASSDTSCGKELCIVAQLFHIRPLVTLAIWGSVPCHWWWQVTGVWETGQSWDWENLRF